MRWMASALLRACVSVATCEPSYCSLSFDQVPVRPASPLPRQAMAPKFAGTRRTSAGGSAGSSSAPTPRVAKIPKLEISMTLTALPFGNRACYVSEHFAELGCTAWVLDLNAPATKIYDASPLFQEYLRTENVKNKDFPGTLEDLQSFGMVHICGTKPKYYRLLFVDNDADGFRDGYWLMRGFVEFLCCSPTHSKKLGTLAFRVINCTKHPTVNFDVKMNSTLTLTTTVSSPSQLSMHPCELRHPDRRGYAHLSFLAAPPDVAAEVRPTLSEEDDGVVWIPQFTGCWWGVRTVLQESGFQDITEEGTLYAKKIFQASAVTAGSGQRWLENFLAAMEETPMLVTCPPDMTDFQAALDLPHIQLQRA